MNEKLNEVIETFELIEQVRRLIAEANEFVLDSLVETLDGTAKVKDVDAVSAIRLILKLRTMLKALIKDQK